MVQDLGTDWVVEMEWPEGDTQGGPTVITIRPSDPESPAVGGLSSTVLRGINFRDAAAQLRKQLAVGNRRRKTRDNYDADRINRVRDELDKGITPEYLALLSTLYLSRVNAGQPKPVEGIADELGKGLQTVRGHLWQARNQGILVGAQGRKGGQLSPEAVEILERIVPGAGELEAFNW
ncbi:hypothetical protein [Mycobacterium sp. D16Q16]|uniref:hypothetical protein n=1 Tax=Mycobacterium sp. D16Q16 TaxID=1855659 RepID=UPI001591E507|nr:hypothetical protein [Mycobacterium sp. D16Q16]